MDTLPLTAFELENITEYKAKVIYVGLIKKGSDSWYEFYYHPLTRILYRRLRCNYPVGDNRGDKRTWYLGMDIDRNNVEEFIKNEHDKELQKVNREVTIEIKKLNMEKILKVLG